MYRCEKWAIEQLIKERNEQNTSPQFIGLYCSLAFSWFRKIAPILRKIETCHTHTCTNLPIKNLRPGITLAFLRRTPFLRRSSYSSYGSREVPHLLLANKSSTTTAVNLPVGLKSQSVADPHNALIKRKVSRGPSSSLCSSYSTLEWPASTLPC